MFRTFFLSYQLKNTYRVNSIIYAIRQFPGLKKILPKELYRLQGLKILGNVLGILWEIFSLFLGHALYVGLLIFAPCFLYGAPDGETFLHIFVCLTVIGGFLNTYMFNPTNDKFYAMVLLRMDARSYTISNYCYQMIKMVVGFLPFTLLFGSMAGLSVWMCALLPVFVLCVKLAVVRISLIKYEKTGDTTNENLPPKQIWSLVIVLLAAAYALPAIGVKVTALLFLILLIIAFVLAFISVRHIWRFSYFSEMYKQILAQKRCGIDQEKEKLIRAQSEKLISQDQLITSSRKGFEYFNELFVKRHQKILWKPIRKVSVICLGVLAVVFLVTLNLMPKQREVVNYFVMNRLPYVLFLMYLINRGAAFTRVLFVNCDHSMLTYSFYKEPGKILKLFQIRLRELVKVNLLPAAVVAAGLPLLLWASGGTENLWNYVLMPVSILALSVFFSVHHLTCYYLIQPYNASTEVKSSLYMVVVWVTYFVCFFLMQREIETFMFTFMTLLFCVGYCVVASFLVYKFAAKTFRLRT